MYADRMGVLGRLGFSYSKPRPIPDKSASKTEQEQFKQETAALLEEMARQSQAEPCGAGL